MGSRDAPWCPPIVRMCSGLVGHLLAWEMHERDGSWHGWVSWIQETGARYVHKVADVRAGSLQPLEQSEAYAAVPRRVRGNDGVIRPWARIPLMRAFKSALACLWKAARGAVRLLVS